jgi:tetratricopeptide (TPR) repeat protein
LATLSEPKYSGRLNPNQQYALGYWTLELRGQSLDPPLDLGVAENKLATAFREWKETKTDEVQATNAFDELLNRYGGRLPPPWYMDMLQRLAALRPRNFYIAYALGARLTDGRSVADVDKALTWLARAREQIGAPIVPPALRPVLSAWVDYSIANSYSTQVRIRAEKSNEQAAQEAEGRLKALIQRLQTDGVIRDPKWPGASAYTALIATYQSLGEIDKAVAVLDASRRDGLSEHPEVLSNRFSLLLAVGREDDALQLAKSARDMPGFDRVDALFLAALSQLLTNQPDAEYAAREFLATSHEYRDYIRLMLYWYLARQGKVDQAKSYLDERWRDINPGSWPARLAHGDPQVWRERLIGYYLGRVKRDDLFEPLGSRESFESSGLGRIGVSGLTFDGMRCEAYFYDALLQDVTGDSATRSMRYAQTLGRALEVGHADMYEYLMARYLLSQVKANTGRGDAQAFR